MFIALIIFRILFVISIIIIIRYIFSRSEKSQKFTNWAKAASIAVIVFFVLSNVFLMRANFRGFCNDRDYRGKPGHHYAIPDSTRLPR